MKGAWRARAVRVDWHDGRPARESLCIFGDPAAHWQDCRREALHTFTITECTESAISRMATTEETREGRL